MKRIAILNCLNANRVCTGAACLQAWNTRDRGFFPYREQEAELTAFLRCNGCGSDPGTDPGMLEKLDRLMEMKTDIVHLGRCTRNQSGVLCPTIQRIRELLEERGIPCVDGTH